MEREEIRRRFNSLGVWQKAGERAPYKPLLLLWAFARYRSGAQRLIPYSEIDQQLPGIFRAFGPARRQYHSEYPFWYLQTDGVWQVVASGGIMTRRGTAAQPTKGSLLASGAAGGLQPAIFRAVVEDEQLLREIVSDLLNAHFPETLHEEILSAVGLEFVVTRAVRNALFRQNVLQAYGFRCAVCSFDARLVDSLLGIEAAHIKWHQAGGPGSVDNGIAMCSLHHNLFDRGAFTLTADYRIEVSEQVNGGPATVAHVIQFHAKQIAIPPNPTNCPHQRFVKWHRQQVFKAPGRWLDLPAA